MRRSVEDWVEDQASGSCFVLPSGFGGPSPTSAPNRRSISRTAIVRNLNPITPVLSNCGLVKRPCLQAFSSVAVQPVSGCGAPLRRVGLQFGCSRGRFASMILRRCRGKHNPCPRRAAPCCIRFLTWASPGEGQLVLACPLNDSISARSVKSGVGRDAGERTSGCSLPLTWEHARCVTCVLHQSRSPPRGGPAADYLQVTTARTLAWPRTQRSTQHRPG